MGEVVRRDILSKDGLKAQLNTPQAIAALTYTVVDHQRGGRLEQVQGVPRHVGLLRAAEPARQGPARVLADGELHLQRRSPTTRPNVDLIAQVLHEPQGRPDHDVQRQRLGRAEGLEERGRRVRVHEGRHLGATRGWPPRRSATTRARLPARPSPASTRRTRSPTRRSTRTSTSPSAIRSSTTRCKILVNAPRYGFELPPSPGGQQFVQAYIDAVNRVLAGQQTPKAGAEPGAEGSAGRDQRQQVSPQ